MILFEIIIPNTFIGLRSPPESLKLFFVAKVLSKTIAEQFMEDENGRGVLPGESYIVVQYLEKISERRSAVKYKLVKTNSYVHMEVIFATVLDIYDELIMNMTECQSL